MCALARIENTLGNWELGKFAIFKQYTVIFASPAFFDLGKLVNIMWEINEMNIAAANGKPLPPNLTAPEQCAFLSLRNLYVAFAQRKITRAQAVKEKNEILQQYRVWSNAYTQHWNDCVEIQARNHIGSEWLNKLHKSMQAGADYKTIAGQAAYCVGLIVQDRPLADAALSILSEEAKP